MEVISMAQNISDTVLSNTIDQMAAVTKGFVGAYTSHFDLFNIISREDNPDDESTGIAIVEPIDDGLDAGTAFFSIWTTAIGWLNSRAAAAGSANLDALLTARHLRVPSSFDSDIYFPYIGAHLTAGSIFQDYTWDLDTRAWEFYTFGTITRGGSPAWVETHATVSSTTQNCVLSGKLTVVNSAAPWTVSATATLDTTAVAPLTAVITYTIATTTPVGATVISNALTTNHATRVSKAGTKQFIAAANTGIVKGHKFLLWTGRFPTLLTATATGGQNEITIDPALVGSFESGDEITVYNVIGTSGETAIIETIDYEHGILALRSNLGATYATTNDSVIYKTKCAKSRLLASVVPGTGGPYTINVGIDATWKYYVGHSLFIDDDNSNVETLTITSIDNDAGAVIASVALTTGITLGFSYSLGQNAIIYTTVEPYGHAEWIQVASVVGSYTIATEATLQHSYYSASDNVHFLITGLTTVANSGGGGSPALQVQPMLERQIQQNAIIY
jgi:hypothetical protein